jgi:type VI secretion system protein ImpG
VEVRSKPFARSSTGFKYIYRVTLAELHSSMLPVVDLFAAKLLAILKAWSTEDVVELEVLVPSLERTLSFTDTEVEV